MTKEIIKVATCMVTPKWSHIGLELIWYLKWPKVCPHIGNQIDIKYQYYYQGFFIAILWPGCPTDSGIATETVWCWRFFAYPQKLQNSQALSKVYKPHCFHSVCTSASYG